MSPERAGFWGLPYTWVRVARRWLAQHWLTLAVGLGAALPVIVSTIRGLAAGWVPTADQGTIAMRAYDVLTAHTPLLGQYSMVSAITGHTTYSPGPMLYWLLALPARFGAPASLAVTMGIVNTGAIVGIVALARRRGGRVLMFATAIAVAVMCRSLSSENLHDIFNPSAAVFPFTLLIFVCWSLACGDYRLLPLAVLLASFVAQCHLVFVLPGLGLLAVGLVGLAASRDRSRSRRRWPWALAAAAVALICWSAPLVDQIAHRPGNLALIIKAARVHTTTEGAAVGWRAVSRVVGIPPRWLRAPGTRARRVGGVSGGDYGDTRLNDVWTAPSALSTASGVVLLGALLVAGLVGLRRGRGDIAAGAAIGLVLCAALGAVVAAAPTRFPHSLGYILWWGSAAGMWVWLILAWSVAVLVRTRGHPAASLRAPAFASLLGACAVAAAGATVAARQKPDTHGAQYRPIQTVDARLDSTIPHGRTVKFIWRGATLYPIEPAISFALRRRDIRVLGIGSSVLLGRWYELDHNRYDYVVSVYAGGTPPVKPARVVARVSWKDGRHLYMLTAALSPARARRREP